MGKIQSALIAGAGGIGSSVAWTIHNALPGAVSLLAGGERLSRYRADGFVINGSRVDFPLMDASSDEKADLVIVACKGHHLSAVIDDLRTHIGAETLILSLLNGISSEDELGAAFGSWRTPYAMIVGTDAWHSGNVTEFSKTGTIFFGDAENGANRSDRVRDIAEFFDRAGVAYTVPDNMLNRLWYKFMMNVGINQVTAILRQPYRILKTGTRDEGAAAVVDAAMREVAAIALKEGIVLTEDDRANVYRTLDTLGDGGKTSMCQDVEACRKTELELFAGKVRELGARHGIPVPVNETLFGLISAIERNYGR